MAVDSTVTELTFTGMVVNVPLFFDVQTYAASHIHAYYGTQEIEAVQGLDYTAVLAGDYSSVTITPLAPLFAKIADANVAVGGDNNRLRVNRLVELTTDFTETDAFVRRKIANEYDLVAMRIQQLNTYTGHIDSRVTTLEEAFAIMDGDLILQAANDAIAAAAALGNQVHQYDTYAEAFASNIPAGVKGIRIHGYFTCGDGGGALYKKVGAQPTHWGKGQSADGAWWEIVPENGILMAESFAAIADAATDCAVPFQRWWDTCKALKAEGVGRGGTYCIGSTVSWTGTALFDPGPRIRFAGGYRTFIDNKCPVGTACFVINGGTLFTQGGYIKNCTFKSSNASPIAAVSIKALYRFTFEDVIWENLTGNGCVIKNDLGDADAVNQITFLSCFFNNCLIGLLHDFAPTIVQASYVRCIDCFFQANRTAGWYYIGLSGGMVNTHFTENGNGVGGQGGFIAANNSGSNAAFSAIDCSWENNYVASVRLNAMTGGLFQNCEIAGGSGSIVSAFGFVLNGCIKTKITGTRARVSVLNPFTMYILDANSHNNVIEDTYWRTFFSAGQVAYNIDPAARGNRIEKGRMIGNEADTVIACGNGANNNKVVPIDGDTFAFSGPSGAYQISGFTNGWDGRHVMFWNNTAQNLTLQHETTSSANNRLQLPGAADCVIPTKGFAAFVYFGGSTNRWVMSSKVV